MALKLSRDLKQNVQKDIQENTSNSKTGFNIQCVPGKEYDLDEILAIRKRDNPDAPLFLRLISVDSATSKDILARIIRDVDLLAHENLMLPEVKEAIANTITSTYETFGYVVGEELNPDRYEMVYEVINKKITRYLNAISEKFQLDYKIMPGTNLPDIVVKYNINEIFMGSDDFAAIVTDYYNRYASTMNAAFVEETEGALSMEGGEERVKKVSPTVSDYKKYLLDKPRDINVEIENNIPPVSVKPSRPPRPRPEIPEQKPDKPECGNTELSEIRDQLNDLTSLVKEFASKDAVLEDRIDSIQGGEITNPELDTLKEVSNKISKLEKENERKPIYLEINDGIYWED